MLIGNHRLGSPQPRHRLFTVLLQFQVTLPRALYDSRFMTRRMIPMVMCAVMTGAWSQAQVFEIQPTPNPLKANNELYAAAAISATDEWAVGQVALHWNGSLWSSVPIVGTGVVLNGVAAVTSNDVWAAGALSDINTGFSHAVIEHWNGAAWVNVTPPRPGVSSVLTSIAAFSSSDVWAAGWFENSSETAIEPLVEQWNGATWTQVRIPVAQSTVFLTGIAGSSSTDVSVVGYTEPGSTDQPLAAHWNGSTWTVMKPPARGTGSSILYGVVAPAPNDAWAIGLSTPQGPPAESPTITLIEHWNGSAWQIVPSPNVGPTSKFQSNRLFGITALSATDIWAVGSSFAANGSGNQSTLVEHWNGTNWTINSTPNLGFSDTLDGAAAIDGLVWPVGTYFGGPVISSTLVLSAAGI